jgi:branched-subunit amino acid transport protein
VTFELIAALAVMTYASRALALAYLPPFPERLATIVDRMPPALFAGLAAHALIGADGGVADAPVLAAAAGALVVSPLRSLPICLAAGLVAFFAVATLAGQGV